MGVKSSNIIRPAFNTITTGKVALFVLSALIRGIFSGRMAPFSFPNSGKWHIKEERTSLSNTQLHETLPLKKRKEKEKTFRDSSTSVRRCI
jgi:hypothetical protein